MQKASRITPKIFGRFFASGELVVLTLPEMEICAYH
jgi:hypothetical protein